MYINPNFINQHPAIAAVVGFWLFSAIASGQPAPKPTSSTAYEWIYNSLHFLSANLDKFMASKVPANQLPTIPAGSTVLSSEQSSTLTVTPPPKS
jgi:hypothetical protein